MKTLQEAFDQKLKDLFTNARVASKIDAVIAYYTPCAYFQSWNSEVPVLILYGAIDNVAPLINCKSIFKDLQKIQKTTIYINDNAHHCFDNSDLQPEIKILMVRWVTNEAAAKAAWKEVTEFLKR